MTAEPAFPKFKKLEVADRTAIETFTRRFEPYSDLNFTSLWSWDVEAEVQWSVLNDNIIVRLPNYGSCEPPRFTLLGDNEMQATAYRLLTEGDAEGELSLVPEVVAARLANDDRFEIREDTDNADYVIDIPQFLGRSGGHYEQLRREIGLFVKRSTPEVIDLELSSRQSRDFVEAVSRQWLAVHSKVGVISNEQAAESAAIMRSFDLNKSLSAVGLLIEGEPYSFTIYEVLGGDWAIGHFAKTARPLRGATLFGMDAALSRCAAANALLYNEEQDLGVPGLRTAKQRHRPARFLKKYSVALRAQSAVADIDAARRKCDRQGRC